MIPPVNLTLWFLPFAVLLGTIAGYLVRPVVERVVGWWKWREAEKVIAELVEAERAQYTADNSVVIYTCDRSGRVWRKDTAIETLVAPDYDAVVERSLWCCGSQERN